MQVTQRRKAEGAELPAYWLYGKVGMYITSPRGTRHITSELFVIQEQSGNHVPQADLLVACRRDNVTADAAGRIGILPLDLSELLHDAAIGLTSPMANFSAHTASPPPRTPAGSRASSRHASIAPANNVGP